ncbi:transposase domain-containing protein [Phthorimaea operculella]|nr:transposase domain-containing protein [Phthorimaea operculella]
MNPDVRTFNPPASGFIFLFFPFGLRAGDFCRGFPGFLHHQPYLTACGYCYIGKTSTIIFKSMIIPTLLSTSRSHDRTLRSTASLYDISLYTVRRHLHAAGIHNYKPAMKPAKKIPLNEEQCQARIRFATGDTKIFCVNYEDSNKVTFKGFPWLSTSSAIAHGLWLLLYRQNEHYYPQIDGHMPTYIILTLLCTSRSHDRTLQGSRALRGLEDGGAIVEPIIWEAARESPSGCLIEPEAFQ